MTDNLILKVINNTIFFFNFRIQQTESVIYIIALSDPKQIEKQLEK